MFTISNSNYSAIHACVIDKKNKHNKIVIITRNNTIFLSLIHTSKGIASTVYNTRNNTQDNRDLTVNELNEERFKSSLTKICENKNCSENTSEIFTEETIHKYCMENQDLEGQDSEIQDWESKDWEIYE